MPQTHRCLGHVTLRKGCVKSIMGYKKESNDEHSDLDWISFPDEPEPKSSASFDVEWSDEMDKRADDLLVVSQLETIVRKLHNQADAEIKRRDQGPVKKLPLWARVLLHTPQNNKQVLLYHATFVSLMILAVALFIYAMGLVR